MTSSSGNPWAALSRKPSALFHLACRTCHYEPAVARQERRSTWRTDRLDIEVGPLLPFRRHCIQSRGANVRRAKGADISVKHSELNESSDTTYDRSPLDPRVEPMPETEHWRAELVSIASAYGRERVPVYLLLPKNAAPPYQPVIWFPGGYAFGLFPLGRDLSGALGAVYFNFLTRSGRALVIPVYQGTFQRFAGVGEFPRDDQMNAYRDTVVQWSKDLGRTIDYLEHGQISTPGKWVITASVPAPTRRCPSSRSSRACGLSCCCPGDFPRFRLPGGGSDQFRAAHHGPHADAERA